MKHHLPVCSPPGFLIKMAARTLAHGGWRSRAQLLNDLQLLRRFLKVFLLPEVLRRERLMTMSARRPRPDRTRSVREWTTAKAARVPSRSTAGGTFTSQSYLWPLLCRDGGAELAQCGLRPTGTDAGHPAPSWETSAHPWPVS